MRIGFAELSAPNIPTLRLEGDTASDPCMYIEQEGVQGWYSTPDLKVSLTERGDGDGAHDVPDSAVAYAARTVTLRVFASGRDRDETLEQWRRLLMFTHRQVTLRIRDSRTDTECVGMVSTVSEGEWHEGYLLGDLTVVCARPERVAHTPSVLSLIPHRASAGGGGGLMYGPGYFTECDVTPNDSESYLYLSTVGTLGLRYPLTYSVQKPTAGSNSCLVENHGSSRAYPVFTCYGNMPDGVDIVFPGENLWLRCTQPVYGEPLVLDSRSRTATVGGLDVSRTLVSRGFPTVPPDGMVNCVLRTTGTGYVNVTVRDTYM
ncbi:hypothetical protein [Bifidobacterium magnum]|uniref:hypothetical protein n=1 Tax=Bifidobacterium magnum TaxID=1692 RepID=UPI0003B53186|nr:hypothetical protein [Bifidobacterium magnum]